MRVSAEEAIWNCVISWNQRTPKKERKRNGANAAHPLFCFKNIHTSLHVSATLNTNEVKSICSILRRSRVYVSPHECVNVFVTITRSISRLLHRNDLHMSQKIKYLMFYFSNFVIYNYPFCFLIITFIFLSFLIKLYKI